MVLNNIFNNIMGKQNVAKTPSDLQNNDKQSNNLPLGKNIVEVEPDSLGQKNENVEYKGSSVYNLIILDESGSMACVTNQTISGCNETLNSIRTTANEDPEQKHFVSIFCFDTSNSRYLFLNKSIEEVRELNVDDYHPTECTPLYDAIGYTVTQLARIANSSNATGKVTIITDGYENASQKWNLSAIVELIQSLKEKGWVFTFMGANIDVAQTSHSMGIDSFIEFQQTNEGMREMFENERRSHRAYSKKVAYMRGKNFFMDASESEKQQMLGAMNKNYFTEENRISPKEITHLDDDQIFVFGSNVHGLHNGGAAGLAFAKWGAIMGQAEGPQGQSYAIPTDGNCISELKDAIERFTEYVVRHPKQKFVLTAIGCGNAGYTANQIAPLFRQAYEFGNVYIPVEFVPFMNSIPF